MKYYSKLPFSGAFSVMVVDNSLFGAVSNFLGIVSEEGVLGKSVARYGTVYRFLGMFAVCGICFVYPAEQYVLGITRYGICYFAHSVVPTPDPSASYTKQ